jgi:hypothetical protein
MSFGPPPPMGAPVGPMNPIEGALNSLNTNSYLIGVSMLMLNLGGRRTCHGSHARAGASLSESMDPGITASLCSHFCGNTKPVYRVMVDSRRDPLNQRYLSNETSDLYLFGPPVEQPAPCSCGAASKGAHRGRARRLQTATR